MPQNEKPEKDPIIVDAEVVRDDTYNAQREEMRARLQGCLDQNHPLSIHGRDRLTPDDIYAVFQKVKYNQGFSRRERSALTDAGFDLDKIYPDL